jgi:hypothetical protein
MVPVTTLPPIVAVPETPTLPLPPPVPGGAFKLAVDKILAAALSSAYSSERIDSSKALFLSNRTSSFRGGTIKGTIVLLEPEEETHQHA